MGRNNGDFRSAQIAGSQQVSHAIREGWVGGYKPKKDRQEPIAIEHTDGELFGKPIYESGKPQVNQKRIRQARGKE